MRTQDELVELELTTINPALHHLQDTVGERAEAEPHRTQRSSKPEQWTLYSGAPTVVRTRVDMPGISLEKLLSLGTGGVLVSSHQATQTIPLLIGGVFIASGDFEPAGDKLAVRISGFESQPRPIKRSTNSMDEMKSSVASVVPPDHVDTLRDLVLPASLCFGSTVLTLRRILHLTIGDLIILDKEIDAPVSLIVGERIVATGDLVLVNGFYAIRLTAVSLLAKHLPQSQARPPASL